MAWISVDQKLIGGKLRSLYKAIGCSQNEAIGILVSLWLWGIDNAEMDGLMVSADREDIKQSFQAGLSKEVDGDTVVACLIDTGWIDEVDGQLYLHDWGDWRSYYNRYVREKENHAERMRRYRDKKIGKESTGDIPSDISSDVTGDISQEHTDAERPAVEKPEKKSRKEEQEEKHGKDFEEFWSVYPKKVDKGEAYKKYKARRKEGYSAEEILAAAKAYRAECERKHTDRQYIKHAKTFLGPNLSFTEYIPRNPEPAPAPAPAQAPAGGVRSM